MSQPITVAGTDIGFECADDRTVLEAAEGAGWAIPYSCRKGVCSTCSGRLESGTLELRTGGTVSGPAEDVLLCQARPIGPVEISPRRITDSAPPVRRTLTTRVYRVRRPAPRVTVLELRFPIGRRVPFRAGQYLSVRLPDGDTRPYSMANAPQANDVAELHVRTETGGRFSEQIAGRLLPGDLLTVETPFGQVTLDEGTAPLVLLATGTGFAPVKSLVQDQITRRGSRPMHLYWGGRTEEDLYLLDQARRWAVRHPWFSVTPVLSRPAPGWAGARGRVQDVALADHPDLSGHEVYACGAEAMTSAAFAALTSRAGLPEDRFHADAFVPLA
jgi:CDP-4-dehydro-6-deoxyglucose reductase/3-phenylpropionate/trans-cinnamate dioxygenase ferredoxin reductase subunit